MPPEDINLSIAQALLFLLAGIEGLTVPWIVNQLKIRFNLHGRAALGAAALVSTAVVVLTYLASGAVVDDPAIWSNIHTAIGAAIGVSQFDYFVFWKRIAPAEPPPPPPPAVEAQNGRSRPL